jgi:hypothetical protein
MADLWFYSHDGVKIGPCSAQQLQQTAAAGGLVPTDTVWKEGTEKGALASKVKNLFASPEIPATLPALAPILAPASGPAEIEPVAAADPAGVEAVAETRRQAPPPQKPKTNRAVAGRGAIVVSQDGVRVSFRKTCIVCKYEDTCRHNVLIRQGKMSVPFFCPKCRKNRPVELQCMSM